MITVHPGYLINIIRLFIGDIDETKFRYTNEWINIAIQASINTLGKWWGNKYVLDTNTGEVYRNPNIEFYGVESTPVILPEDEKAIILMACVIILEGSLENSSWSLASWRDNEVSFSNLESGRQKSDRIKRLWDELLNTMLPPTKRLAKPLKGSLRGYKGNEYETTTEF